MFKRIRQTALLAALAAAVALPASAGVPEGVALLNKQDYKAAMKEFEAEAAKDNSEAMYYIGEIFHRGLGMNPQRLTGIHWWEKAAYLGNERAMLALSEVFNKGLGVKAEPRQAYVWDLTAARQGNPLAQYNVGTYWLYGTSVPKDLTEAAKWFRRSALQGNPAALDALARQLNMGDGVERDVFAAYVLFDAASKPSDKFDSVYTAAESAKVIRSHMNADDLKYAQSLSAEKILKELETLEKHEPQY